MMQIIARTVRSTILIIAALWLAGCVTAPPPLPQPTVPSPGHLPVPAIPDNPDDVSNAIPRAEPRSKQGNPPFYTVMGKRYFVMSSAKGYVERGVASWYGPGFHAANTSNGEKYDMYAMTAAHKTLPLPTYVQVTNLSNGKSVTLRVNDRGPFKDTRIIDLSYTAALKLDIIKDGTAFVEVRAITPGDAPATEIADKDSSLFVQAGAFSSEANAKGMIARLKTQGVSDAFAKQDTVNGKPIYRVRIGPIPTVQEFDKVLARLKGLGIADARLAND